MLQEWYGRFFDIAMDVRTNGAGNDDGGVVLGARDYKVHVHDPRLPQHRRSRCVVWPATATGLPHLSPSLVKH